MFIRIWQFRPHPEKLSDFLSVYGSRGDWSTLFQKGSGFLGTELVQSTTDSNLYLTIDRWDSSEAWETFLKTFATEYAALDKQCESLTMDEVEVGSFLTNFQ